jgi:hypothetical protein
MQQGGDVAPLNTYFKAVKNNRLILLRLWRYAKHLTLLSVTNTLLRNTLNGTTDMALSNAERQRQYRQRRINDGKAKVGVFISAEAMNKLNELAQKSGASIATVLDALILDKTIEVVAKPTSLDARLAEIEARLAAIEGVTPNVTANVTAIDIIEETVPEPLGADLRSVPDTEFALDAPAAVDSDYPLAIMTEAVLMKTAGKTNKQIIAMIQLCCGKAPREGNIGRMGTKRKDTLEHFAKLTGKSL